MDIILKITVMKFIILLIQRERFSDASDHFNRMLYTEHNPNDDDILWVAKSHIYNPWQDNFVFHLRSLVCKQAGTARDYKTWHVSLEKDRTRYCSYQFHMETAKKVHEPLKEGAKDHDVCICRDDWGVLRVDDIDMSDFNNN